MVQIYEYKKYLDNNKAKNSIRLHMMPYTLPSF